MILCSNLFDAFNSRILELKEKRDCAGDTIIVANLVLIKSYSIASLFIHIFENGESWVFINTSK